MVDSVNEKYCENTEIFKTRFEQVFDVLQMATLHMDYATGAVAAVHSQQFQKDENLQIIYSFPAYWVWNLILEI